LPRSNVCSTRDLENPSASVHLKRFSTPSLTLKFLCAGKLNPRIIIIQAKYTFPANSNQYRFNNEFISNHKLLTLHSIASFDLQLSVAPRPHGEPLRGARFPDSQAHLRSTRQHRRRPSPAPSTASTARSLPQDLRSFPGADAIGHPQCSKSAPRASRGSALRS
jgi:hypothetical protein